MEIRSPSGKLLGWITRPGCLELPLFFLGVLFVMGWCASSLIYTLVPSPLLFAAALLFAGLFELYLLVITVITTRAAIQGWLKRDSSNLLGFGFLSVYLGFCSIVYPMCVLLTSYAVYKVSF